LQFVFIFPEVPNGFFGIAILVGGSIQYGEALTPYPVVAPALIIVGCFMLKNVGRTD